MKMRMMTVGLALVLVGAPVSLTATSASKDLERSWMVVNEDVNTTIAQIPDEKLGREALREHFEKQVMGRRLTHYFVNPQAMRFGYATKVGEPFWTEHPGLKPAPDWVRKFVWLDKKGIDPYQVWIDCAREKNVSPWISMRMNDAHCLKEPMNGFATRMWLDHPEWRRSLPPYGPLWEAAFNYAVPEVSAYFLAVAREMMERYDTDGFECDWTRFPHHLPRGNERAHAHVLTEFMSKIRRMADEVGAKRGRRLNVGVRVVSSPEGALGIGTDVVEWVRRGYADVVTVGNFWTSVDFDTPWADWKRLIAAANPRAKLLVSLDDGIYRTCDRRSTLRPDEVAGFFDVALAGGATDGISVFNWFVGAPDFYGASGREVRKLTAEDGVTSANLANRKRTYAVTFRDAVGDDMPSNSQLPMKINCRRELFVTVGRPVKGDCLTVKVYWSKDSKDTEKLLAGATLNGFRPEDVKGDDVCVFPHEAVKPGRNVFAVGPAVSAQVVGLALSLESKIL